MNNVNISYIESENDVYQESFSRNQYAILQQLVLGFNKFGENKINIDAATAISNRTEFLVCGPSRVGKSSLIKALTGQNVPTSASLNPNTQFATCYSYENESVVFWDTKGFENWDKEKLDDFWYLHYNIKHILPSFCLFCVGVGAHANLELIRYMFETYLFRYKIPICWVITKAGVTDIPQTRSYINEGISLLGNIVVTIKETIAWKAEKGFILRVNSVEAQISIPNQQQLVTIKTFGLSTLLYVLATNISVSSQQHLMKLYKENESVLSYISSSLFETAYKLGMPVTNYLDNDKRELFQKAAGGQFDLVLIRSIADAIIKHGPDFYLMFKKYI